MKMVIKKSNKPGKDYMATFTRDNGRTKTTHFGDANLDHYTSGATMEQRTRYRKRHKKDLTTNDPTRAGYLSYYILWGESRSIRKNIKSYKNRFNLK
jgi:hypothetical protein